MNHIVPRVSSALKAVDLIQSPPPLIIGERLNSQGSRRAKKMVLDDDIEGLVGLAREQVEDGAHCLDICVATTEKSDEADLMKKLVKKLSLEIDAPLVIDSTDPKVISETLSIIPAKPIINSVNLEGDGSRFHMLAPLMKKYGVPAIAMCIGPNGMAKTAEEKLNTAKLLFRTGTTYGLEPWQYLFDVLTFTLATGEQEYANSAIETLRGVTLVKNELRGCLTTLGLSNVSFGLPQNARKILNSVFLDHAIRAGLDTVIINAKDIIPLDEIDKDQVKLANDLLYNKHPNALSELISHFENKSGTLAIKSKPKELDRSWSADKKCHFRIVNRLKDGIEIDVRQAISDRLAMVAKKEGPRSSESIISPENGHQAAVTTLNEVLLPAMKEVGDKFGAGELILPFVLKSAECMKAAVSELERFLIKKSGVSKGKVVLCTVYGDVHDIGKNLVKTILVNNGYTVYDLGKQVPMQKIVDKVQEVNADAVGLSALLVSTSKQMQYFVEYARDKKLNIPVMCGGAAINSEYINRIAITGGTYKYGVFYCKTAFDGLNVMNKLMSGERDEFVRSWEKKLINLKYKAKDEVKVVTLKSNVVPVQPPDISIVDEPIRLDSASIDLNKVWDYLNKKSLFVLSWGFRGKAASELDQHKEELFLYWKKKVIEQNMFCPSVVYGYFKCSNMGDNLLVRSRTGDVVFEFPRSLKPKHLSITDYFGTNDIVAFQAVTVGSRVTEKIEELNSSNQYTEAYYLHGLAVETAEALAEWTHSIIRRDLKLDPNRGLRYSWGYPSCPDISQHRLVWKLLDPTKCGMSLTSAGQIIPEQSTAAIVVHHPDAEYFLI